MRPKESKMKRSAVLKRKSDRLKSREGKLSSIKSEWKMRKDSVLLKCRENERKNGESVKWNNCN
jgi:hypothetical protein